MPAVSDGARYVWSPSSANSTPSSASRACRSVMSRTANPAVRSPSPQRSRCARTGPAPVGSQSSISLPPSASTRRRPPRYADSVSRAGRAPRRSAKVRAAAWRSRTASCTRSTRSSMGSSRGDGTIAAHPHPGVGVVLLTGAGRGFCAGGDVKAMAEGREFGGTSLEDKAQGLRARMEVSRWLHELPKPTIAMVRGAAAGAGLSLALACDLRIASDTARFASAFARVGYSGDFGGSWFLTQLVGTARARELYYTADIVDAQQALALGLVNRVVPDARLEDETLGLASRLARGPRIAYRYMKRNFNAAESGTLKDALDLEAWHHTRCGMTEDHREAARAFVEKQIGRA